MKKRICIISFSPVYRDSRVLRQIDYLSPIYDLTVVGYGHPHPSWKNVEWIGIERYVGPIDKVATSLLLILGRLWPPLYDIRYRNRPHYRQAREILQARSFDAFYANEWAAVPLAVQCARRNGAPVVYDAHEFSPLEREDHRPWLLFYAPMIRYLLRRYTPGIAGAITVCQPIAERYAREFGFKPIVVMNTPKPVQVPDRPTASDHIALIHQGSAQFDRRQQILIHLMERLDQRFHLHMMLVDQEPGCLPALKRLAQQVAPTRITFHDPVPPAQVATAIAQYDIGLPLMTPSNFNNLMALPNKFFEAINAGLAVCIGPSPAMTEIVREYGLGCIADGFEVDDYARCLNALSHTEIQNMRQAARRAASVFNADTQLSKVVDLFERLLSATPHAEVG